MSWGNMQNNLMKCEKFPNSSTARKGGENLQLKPNVKGLCWKFTSLAVDDETVSLFLNFKDN